MMHYEGQSTATGESATDDPRDVTCVVCRTMILCGDASHLDIQPRPRSMAEAYAQLTPGERGRLAEHRKRAVKRRAAKVAT